MEEKAPHLIIKYEVAQCWSCSCCLPSTTSANPCCSSPAALGLCHTDSPLGCFSSFPSLSPLPSHCTPLSFAPVSAGSVLDAAWDTGHVLSLAWPCSSSAVSASRLGGWAGSVFNAPGLQWGSVIAKVRGVEEQVGGRDFGRGK